MRSECQTFEMQEGENIQNVWIYVEMLCKVINVAEAVEYLIT